MLKHWAIVFFILFCGSYPSDSRSASNILHICSKFGSDLRSALDDYWQGEPARVARIKEYFPSIISKHRTQWLHQLSISPASTQGLTTDEALSVLESLKAYPHEIKHANRIQNEVFMAVIPNTTHAAIVKNNSSITEEAFGAVPMAKKRIAWHDHFAFIIDRYMGTHLVPPTIKQDETTTFQLYIRSSGAVSEKYTRRRHSNLLDYSHMQLLDLFMSNQDRNFYGNLLMSKRIIAIDFDIGRPGASRHYSNHAIEQLWIKDTILNSDRYIGRKGGVPGIFAKSVIDKLESMSPGILKKFTARHGFVLSDELNQDIIHTRDVALRVIEEWIETYGYSMIIIE